MPKITVAGIPVEVVSDDECEAAHFVVCGSVSHFGDDVFTNCSRCHASICHRPHTPKKPSKICITCFVVTTDPNTTLCRTTPAMAEELKERGVAGKVH